MAAQGITQPLAIGLAGALLLLFSTFLGFSAAQISCLFLLVTGAWIASAVEIVRE
jgi:hypothetical protein